jgi:radical SAM superfamily enzyme YgiQ (UPF0313 family)
MKQILLINPKTNPSRPTGLEYIAEDLLSSDYMVDLLDLTVENDPKKVIKEKLLCTKYVAIGISIFSLQRDNSIDCVDFLLPEIRKMITYLREFSDTPIIIGGIGFSAQPIDILEYVGGDFGVYGCGVPAFKILLKKLKKGEIRAGTIFEQEPSQYLNLGFKRNLVKVDKYWQDSTVYVSTKDGCTESCISCPNTGVRLKLRAPSKTIAELKNISDQGIENIFFTDDPLNVPIEHAQKLCYGMIELPISWSAMVDPMQRFLPEELVDTMRQSGMSEAWLSSDSGSEQILEAFRRKFKPKDLEYATKLFQEKGIRANWYTYFGVPGECKETIDETFALIDKVKPDFVVVVTKIRIYKNAGIAKIAQNEGLVNSEDSLLQPVYYPFPNDLRNYVITETAKRENCSIAY